MYGQSCLPRVYSAFTIHVVRICAMASSRGLGVGIARGMLPKYAFVN